MGDSLAGRLRNVWNHMISRCTNPNDKMFPRYGGRGISVCREWSGRSAEFVRWALANGYQPGLEIDRENNNGNYEPGNCRFVTHSENQRNKSIYQRAFVGSHGFKGLVRMRVGKPWRAQIRVRGKLLYLGTFETKEDAARAYDAKALELFGEFARLNFAS